MCTRIWRTPLTTAFSSVCSPVDFGEEKERLWAYFAVFLILSRRILDIFPSGYILEPEVFADQTFKERFGWVTGNFIATVTEGWSIRSVMMSWFCLKKITHARCRENWPRAFLYLTVFYKMANVIWICVLFIPLLVFIGLRRYLVSNILGFLYLLPWYGVNSVNELAVSFLVPRNRFCVSSDVNNSTQTG